MWSEAGCSKVQRGGGGSGKWVTSRPSNSAQVGDGFCCGLCSGAMHVPDPAAVVLGLVKPNSEDKAGAGLNVKQFIVLNVSAHALWWTKLFLKHNNVIFIVQIELCCVVLCCVQGRFFGLSWLVRWQFSNVLWGFSKRG